MKYMVGRYIFKCRANLLITQCHMSGTHGNCNQKFATVDTEATKFGVHGGLQTKETRPKLHRAWKMCEHLVLPKYICFYITQLCSIFTKKTCQNSLIAPSVIHLSNVFSFMSTTQLTQCHSTMNFLANMKMHEFHLIEMQTSLLDQKT